MKKIVAFLLFASAGFSLHGMDKKVTKEVVTTVVVEGDGLECEVDVCKAIAFLSIFEGFKKAKEDEKIVLELHHKALGRTIVISSQKELEQVVAVLREEKKGRIAFEITDDCLPCRKAFWILLCGASGLLGCGAISPESLVLLAGLVGGGTGVVGGNYFASKIDEAYKMGRWVNVKKLYDENDNVRYKESEDK